MEFEATKEFADDLDRMDELSSYRDEFYIPKLDGKESIYFNGNSLGLQPKRTKDYINQELEDWKEHAGEGHFKGQTPWMHYHEFVTEQMAGLIGAKLIETVVMNTLTANLHLMMVSFYRPTQKRYKILIEYNAFPSDQYAVKSQLKFHGFDPSDGLIELKPPNGTEIVDADDIEQLLKEKGHEIALILLGGVNYYSGQVYDMKQITQWGHEVGCVVGFDLAHGVGNIPLELHDWGVDFAVWCTYKYLNSGPGSLGGCFVHEKHAKSFELPRFSGWWGHNKEERFLMKPDFIPIEGAEGWQLSNPPILSLAAIRASLDIFQEIGIDKLRKKSIKLTRFLRFLIETLLSDQISIITPSEIKHQGCQLSLVLEKNAKQVYDTLVENSVFADWREPNVIRIAPVPLYNSFADVFRFVEVMKNSTVG